MEMSPKEEKDFKVERAKYELTAELYRIIMNFKSVEEPDIKLKDKDVCSVLANMLSRQLNKK